MNNREIVVAGVDVGTECTKAVVMTGDGAVTGRSVASTRGRFEDRIADVLRAASDEAQVDESNLSAVCATGFGATCVHGATHSLSETACHARTGYHHFPGKITVVDVGGRDPKVIHTDDSGHRVESRTIRRCAAGVGTFLMYAARHLDVHPARLEELATSVDEPVPIGSYCSVFAGSEILERLRDGASRGSVALGCIQSIADRIYEIGSFEDPIVITGGVPEYFPGVVRALGRLTGLKPVTVPEPIMAGAIGAALYALEQTKGDLSRIDPERSSSGRAHGP